MSSTPEQTGDAAPQVAKQPDPVFDHPLAGHVSEFDKLKAKYAVLIEDPAYENDPELQELGKTLIQDLIKADTQPELPTDVFTKYFGGVPPTLLDNVKLVYEMNDFEAKQVDRLVDQYSPRAIPTEQVARLVTLSPRLGHEPLFQYTAGLYGLNLRQGMQVANDPANVEAYTKAAGMVESGTSKWMRANNVNLSWRSLAFKGPAIFIIGAGVGAVTLTALNLTRTATPEYFHEDAQTPLEHVMDINRLRNNRGLLGDLEKIPPIIATTASFWVDRIQNLIFGGNTMGKSASSR